jgi:hypothetical protein
MRRTGADILICGVVAVAAAAGFTARTPAVPTPPIAALDATSSGRGPIPPLATTPTPAIDGGGRLWLAWAEGRHVRVAWSADRGRSFSVPVTVTREEEALDAKGESRPKIAVGAEGHVYVTWTRTLAKPYTGEIRFARSTDGGRTFSPPRTLNDDGLAIGHRFDAIAVAADGTVAVLWIDKRDLERALAVGGVYDGAALYYTISRDGGRTFAKNAKARDHVCECCRLAVAVDARGSFVALWRDILPGSVRDHAIGILPAGGSGAPTITRATYDGWELMGCPHHGPSLAVDAANRYHVAWFTGSGPRGPGSFYAVSADMGRTFSAPLRLGDERAEHAGVVSVGDAVWVAWKAPQPGGGSAIMARQLAPARGEPRRVAATAGPSDQPLLVSDGSSAYLSWFTAVDGYRLVPLAAAPPRSSRR